MFLRRVTSSPDSKHWNLLLCTKLHKATSQIIFLINISNLFLDQPLHFHTPWESLCFHSYYFTYLFCSSFPSRVAQTHHSCPLHCPFWAVTFIRFGHFLLDSGYLLGATWTLSWACCPPGYCPEGRASLCGEGVHTPHWTCPQLNWGKESHLLAFWGDVHQPE